MLVRISQLPPVPYVRVSFMCQMQGLSALRPGHLASGTFTRLRLLANLTPTILASCVFISMIESPYHSLGVYRLSRCPPANKQLGEMSVWQAPHYGLPL